ncbi:MAG: acyl transferase [Maribacter sp.]
MAQEGIFNISTEKDFLSHSLDTFQFQHTHNPVYRDFCDYLKVDPKSIDSLAKIPFLPIAFFKSKSIVSSPKEPEITFTSSGTTGSLTSKHLVTDLSIYEESYLKGFRLFYGDITEYCVIALLPSYLERQGSSLIYMAEDLIKKSKHPDSGFFLNDYDALFSLLKKLQGKSTKTLIIGVSFALLEFTERHQLHLDQNTVVMETGGMKGRRKEMIRQELHQLLKMGFGVPKIHSEYGMTELLSQAYSKGDGIFDCPPWMKILIRDTEDPLKIQENGKTGGINVIDLANINSCSFIATQDLGKIHTNGSFEIIGRFDNSDIRGCNLMVL